MEGSQENEVLSTYREFLDKYCSELVTTDTDEDDLPIRPMWEFVLSSELEGECLYWVLQYLSQSECPQILAAHIARATYVRVSKLDLRQFYMEESDDSDDTDELDDNDDIKAPDTKDIRTPPTSEPSIPHIDSRRLLKGVIAIVDDICKQWKKTLPGLHLPQRALQVCSYAIKNTRRKMEDKHVILPDINALFNLKDVANQSYYAVFDGHGGVEAATYTSSHLHCNFLRDNKFNTDVTTAMKNSYRLTDDWFCDRARRYKLRSGTTCVTMLLQDSRAHISWLGDSQVVLVKGGEAINVMNPHKPERPDEKERIEKLGGCVLHYGTWRVNGNIAVSRAIGDVSQKPFICSDAETYSFDLDGSEDYVVLACDGAWDVLAIEDLPELVYNHVRESNGNLSTTAQKIVHYSRDNGSNDNISVIVVFFRDKIAAPSNHGVSFDFAKENGAEGGFDDEKNKNEKDGSRPQSNGDGTVDSASSTGKDCGTKRKIDVGSQDEENNGESSHSNLAEGTSSQSWFRKCVDALLTMKLISTRIFLSDSDDKRLEANTVEN